MLTSNKELKKILKVVEKQGFRTKEASGGGHIKVYAKDKSLGMVTISASPKSGATHKVRNDLKKIGVKF